MTKKDEFGWLAARAAIADLVHAYALAIRKGEPARCESLFTPDASFEVREADPTDPASLRILSRAEGREAVVAYIVRSATQARVFPMIHNLLVKVDGDLAEATSLMMGRVWPDGPEILGEYADSFRCEEGRWRFCSRSYTICRAAKQ